MYFTGWDLPIIGWQHTVAVRLNNIALDLGVYQQDLGISSASKKLVDLNY